MLGASVVSARPFLHRNYKVLYPRLMSYTSIGSEYLRYLTLSDLAPKISSYICT